MSFLKTLLIMIIIMINAIFLEIFLFKTHYLMEPFCVILKRTFSSQHPLHQILKFHCREITVPNTFATPTLVNEAGFTDLLFAYGNTGTIRLLKDCHKVATWEVTNLKEEVKVCCHAILLSLVITKSCDTNLAQIQTVEALKKLCHEIQPN